MHLLYIHGRNVQSHPSFIGRPVGVRGGEGRSTRRRRPFRVRSRRIRYRKKRTRITITICDDDDDDDGSHALPGSINLCILINIDRTHGSIALFRVCIYGRLLFVDNDDGVIRTAADSNFQLYTSTYVFGDCHTGEIGKNEQLAIGDK